MDINPLAGAGLGERAGPALSGCGVRGVGGAGGRTPRGPVFCGPMELPQRFSADPVL